MSTTPQPDSLDAYIAKLPPDEQLGIELAGILMDVEIGRDERVAADPDAPYGGTEKELVKLEAMFTAAHSAGYEAGQRAHPSAGGGELGKRVWLTDGGRIEQLVYPGSAAPDAATLRAIYEFAEVLKVKCRDDVENSIGVSGIDSALAALAHPSTEGEADNE